MSAPFYAGPARIYSLLVNPSIGEFRVDGVPAEGVYGLLQVFVENVRADGTVVERCAIYANPSAPPPGRGWVWSDGGWRRERRHPVHELPSVTSDVGPRS